MVWPAPDSYSKVLPMHGERGCFWEDRDDRRHCGVDFYAPFGGAVLTVEAGEVVEIGVFTTPQLISYWHETHFALVRHVSGFIARYAEMCSLCVNPGDVVSAGERIGSVGCVLDLEKIDATSPPYIRRLKAAETPSMLHFECWQKLPPHDHRYLGGNWFEKTMPSGLYDPAIIFA